MTGVEIRPLGESAVVVKLGNEIRLTNLHKVRAVSRYLEERPFAGMVEFVPAFSTVTIYYEPSQLTYEEVVKTVSACLDATDNEPFEPGRVVRIPVCYGDDFGPDLEDVAAATGLTAEDVIRLHTAGEYTVYMIGFSPGFPYLGGMSERLATPRLATPRLFIPAGSVGIAGMQTGVYPLSSPGGWRLIGRTPIALFQPEKSPPTLLEAGDIVRFDRISEAEFAHLRDRRDGDD